HISRASSMVCASSRYDAYDELKSHSAPQERPTGRRAIDLHHPTATERHPALGSFRRYFGAAASLQQEGSFTGFRNRNTILESTNGRRWRQDDYKYHYHYAYWPSRRSSRIAALAADESGMSDTVGVKGFAKSVVGQFDST